MTDFTAKDLRELVNAIRFSSDGDFVMRMRREYRFLFLPHGIERDSEIAVQMVNKRFKDAFMGKTHD